MIYLSVLKIIFTVLVEQLEQVLKVMHWLSLHLVVDESGIQSIVC